MLIKIPYVIRWGNTQSDTATTPTLINTDYIVDVRLYWRDFPSPTGRVGLTSVRMTNGTEYPLNLLYQDGIDFILNESRRLIVPRNFSRGGNL